MFRFTLSLTLTCLALVAATVPARAASPDPKTLVVSAEELSKARELVQQLGSDDFNTRERAEDELAKMGRAARVALLRGATTDDSQEVRSRCQTLLPRANSLEMKARLEVFLADTAGKYDHDLPGWNQLRSVVRNEWSLLGHPVGADHSLDKAARGVFVELLAGTVNRQLVTSLGTNDEAEIAGMAANRRQELYNQKYGRVVLPNGRLTVSTATRREPSVEDIATLLFVESQTPSKNGPRTTTISILLSSSGFTAAAQGSTEKGRVYREIARSWLETRLDPLDMQYGMTIATTLGMTDQSIRLAVRLLESKGATVYSRGNAAATLARVGNKSHIPLLEKSLTDKSVLITLNRGVVNGKIEATEIQIRDAALAVSIILSGGKPEDYGFVDQHSGNGAIYSYTRYYLPEGKRDAAFDRWKAREKMQAEKK